MITKRELFRWLRTTRAPRRITTVPPNLESYSWEVGVDVSSIRSCPFGRACAHCSGRLGRRGHGKTLAEPRSEEATKTHAARYVRWLREFEDLEKSG